MHLGRLQHLTDHPQLLDRLQLLDHQLRQLNRLVRPQGQPQEQLRVQLRDSLQIENLVRQRQGQQHSHQLLLLDLLLAHPDHQQVLQDLLQ